MAIGDLKEFFPNLDRKELLQAITDVVQMVKRHEGTFRWF